MKTENLVGKTVENINFVEARGRDKIEMILETTDGYSYRYYHQQDCCEWVKIEDIVGEIDDLIGSPIQLAEVMTNNEMAEWNSQTWTFYKFATSKGYVTVRWLGESNGYYSEEVNLQVTKRS